MEAKSAKTSDDKSVLINLKRKRDIEYAAHLNGPSQSFMSQTNKQRRLSRYNKRQLPNSSYGTHMGRSLLRSYSNYNKTGKPHRLMFYRNDEWMDFPKNVVDFVQKELHVKKPFVEINLNDQHFMLDFLNMCQMDLKTNLQTPISWIDETGCCFFPEIFDYDEEQPCDEMVYRNVGPETIEQTQNMDLNTVKKMFLEGMSGFGSAHIHIVNIYRCSSDPLMQMRLDLFKKQAEITKLWRGDANVQYAWLASSKKEAFKMTKYGIVHCRKSVSKSSTYGTGVNLAASRCSYASARYCDADENGVRHLVLCRVIMGSMELLRPGNNRQICPSSSGFDSGVDDIRSPRYFVVWDMNMSTHIYPEFVVSFKVSSNAEGQFRGSERRNNVSRVKVACQGPQGLLRGESSRVNTGKDSTTAVDNLPRSPPWMPFPMLFDFIKDKITSKDMKLLILYYQHYKSNKITRGNFLWRLRLIVGDNGLVSDTLKSSEKKIPSN